MEKENKSVEYIFSPRKVLWIVLSAVEHIAGEKVMHEVIIEVLNECIEARNKANK
jgi:hypothetical protein